jgi:hypothetical protein
MAERTIEANGTGLWTEGLAVSPESVREIRAIAQRACA